MSREDPIHESESGEGGVRIFDSDSRNTVEVEHICVGCGDKIRDYEAFADTVEEQLSIKPIHSAPECYEKANGKIGGDGE